MSAPLKLVVLASGRGSNLQAIIDACHAGNLDAEIVAVFSDKPNAFALQRARDAGIAAQAISPRDYDNRILFDQAFFEQVAACDPDLIVCAGYMRIISDAVADQFSPRMINIHPSLLPKYPGLDTHQRALEAGDAEHGVSVHFVTSQLDGGPIIAQARIPVMQNDSADDLAARLLPIEHQLLIACIDLFAQQRIKLNADGVLLDVKPLQSPLQLQFNATGSVPAQFASV